MFCVSLSSLIIIGKKQFRITPYQSNYGCNFPLIKQIISNFFKEYNNIMRICIFVILYTHLDFPYIDFYPGF